MSSSRYSRSRTRRRDRRGRRRPRSSAGRRRCGPAPDAQLPLVDRRAAGRRGLGSTRRQPPERGPARSCGRPRRSPCCRRPATILSTPLAPVRTRRCCAHRGRPDDASSTPEKSSLRAAVRVARGAGTPSVPSATSSRGAADRASGDEAARAASTHQAPGRRRRGAHRRKPASGPTGASWLIGSPETDERAPCCAATAVTLGDTWLRCGARSRRPRLRRPRPTPRSTPTGGASGPR